MKIGRAIAVALLCVLIAISYYGPRNAFHQVERAAKNNDAEAMSACFDNPALRENLKGQLTRAMNRQLGTHMPDNPTGGFGNLLATVTVGPVTEHTLTPGGIQEIFDYGGRFPVPRLWLDNALNPTTKPEYAFAYRSLNRFVAFPADHRPDGLIFVFARKGLWTWKLASINFPDDPNAP